MITEYIWLKLIRELAFEQPTIALLCKTSVARNVLQYAYDNNLPISNASIRRVDSRASFGAYVDACLFCIEIGNSPRLYQAAVFPDLRAMKSHTTIGVVNGRLAANIEMSRNLAFADGVCSLTWRQGLKHDAASIVELIYDTSSRLRNKLGEVVDVEPQYVYPLLKSSDLAGKDKKRSQRAVIVPQKRIGEDTYQLEQRAPGLWDYLTSHRDVFDRRKSSIYAKRSPFSFFGIGDYSFASYKVAISGMYKHLNFRAIAPVDGKPVMFDDTCYFIACSCAQQAVLVAALLNDPLCRSFLQTIIFWDSKRPVTKKLLQRINLTALIDRIDRLSLLQRVNLELESMNEKLIPWSQDLIEFLKDYSTLTSNVAQLSLLET